MFLNKFIFFTTFLVKTLNISFTADKLKANYSTVNDHIKLQQAVKTYFFHM